MLTKTDLQQIGSLIDRKLDEKLESKFNEKLEPIKKDINTLKKDVAQTRKDVKTLISYFDREYVELRNRIDMIEEHLGLTSKN